MREGLETVFETPKFRFGPETSQHPPQQATEKDIPAPTRMLLELENAGTLETALPYVTGP